jgi:hypothetical protein
MKKLFIYLTSLLILGFTSCNEDFNKNVAPPQLHEQEDAQEAGFKVELGNGLSAPVILSDFDSHASLLAVSVTETPPLPEGATLSYVLQFSTTEDFARYVDMPSTAENNAVFISAADLDAVVKELHGKTPQPDIIYIRIYIYIHTGTSAVRSTATIIGPATVTPIGVAIEPTYYLIGDMNGWNLDTLIRFGHAGGSVYDNPNFAAVVKVKKDTYFRIVPQSAVDLREQGGDFWSRVYGTAIDGDASPAGTVVTEGAGAIHITDSGYVRIILNMSNYTYKIERMNINPLLYVPGNHQGWDPATAPTLYSEKADSIFDGFVYLFGEYKFTTAPDWNHFKYGDAGGGKIDTAGVNFNAPVGFYYLTVNLRTKTYRQILTQWGIIGDATPEGWNASTPMTYNNESNTWIIRSIYLEGGKELKFRANNDWDINMGGTPDNLIQDGPSLRIDASGYYTVGLILSNVFGNSCYINRLR